MSNNALLKQSSLFVQASLGQIQPFLGTGQSGLFLCQRLSEPVNEIVVERVPGKAPMTSAADSARCSCALKATKVFLAVPSSECRGG